MSMLVALPVFSLGMVQVLETVCFQSLSNSNIKLYDKSIRSSVQLEKTADLVFAHSH